MGVAQPRVVMGEAPGANFWSPRIGTAQPKGMLPCSHVMDGETES